MKYSKLYNVSLTLLGATLLTACAAGSKVSPQGTTDEVIWPAVKDVSFDGGRGTFPSRDHLALIREDMTKDQLYHLLGRPHFDEGFFGVQEWDYLFYFHTPGVGVNNVSTCQFKILFDSNMLTRNLYWHAVEPTNQSCPPEQNTFDLSADALFDFDGSELGMMKDSSKEQLDSLAKAIMQSGVNKNVTIVGYTDRLGDANYNQRLSQARAQTVRQYLTTKGISPAKITAIGRGSANPLVQCESEISRSALIECLQPNRRVEVTLD